MNHWREPARAAAWVASWGFLMAYAMGSPGWVVVGLLGGFLALVAWPRGED